MRRIVAVFALGAAAVGCSSVDPSPKVKAATSAIEAAKAAGAASYPASSELIGKAEKYLATAQSMIKDGNIDEAMRQLAMAQSAADAAKVTASEASNQAKVKQLDAQIAELKTKLGM